MLFTSEQVSNGHPDKICDQISDAIVTDCLLNDRGSRVAVECMIKDYDITIAGEITSGHSPDFKDLAYCVLAGIGLPNIEQYTVNRLISKQSPDIALGVDQQGAGDQGMMFGYATQETREMLPVPFVLATAALERLKDSRYPFLLPDAKSQVTYDYRRKRIDTFLISTQHSKHIQGFLVSKGWLEPEPAPDRLTISVPVDGLSVQAMYNLILMLFSKKYLLGKALKEEVIKISDGVIEHLQQTLPETLADFRVLVDEFKAQGQIAGVGFTDNAVSISFPLSDRQDVIHTYTLLTVNIIAAAKAATRVLPDRQQPENEKYYMRNWLVRLGFGGKESKGMRTILLKHLKGHSAFRTDAEAEKHRDKYAEIRRSHKESAALEVQHEEG